jgi:NAD(P)H-dependent flavin oxidoreductase YrpB (nitropropane dioxygenase family)
MDTDKTIKELLTGTLGELTVQDLAELREVVKSRGQDIDDLTQKLSDLEETKAQQLMGRDETINKLRNRTLEQFITAIVDDKVDIALPSAADTAQDVIDEIDSYQVWDMVSDQCSELIREVLADAKVTIEA